MFLKRSAMTGLLVCLMLGGVGCGSNQSVKDVWKGTKSFWYENVSVPASIDYDETGEMSEYKAQLATSVIGIDMELTALEKIMANADKPPTSEWMQALFNRFPWLDGFSGVKADGTFAGQFPGTPMKPLDFTPLLAEDNKQNLRALRGHVQNTPMGPEVFLATPLYDAHTFLGVVSVYFDMRALLDFSASPDELVIVAPQGVLWSGKYNFASTPMAGIQWDSIVLKESSGTVTNAGGKFYWTVRYLGNLPIVFGVAVEGSFAESYNSRSGPIDSAGFLEPMPVEVEVDETDYDEATEVGADESTVTPASPIYPDQVDDTADAPAEEAKVEPVQAAPVTEPVRESASEPSSAPRTFSPIYPDQSDSDDASSDEATSEEAEEVESTKSEPASDTPRPLSPIHPDQPDSADTSSEETTTEEAEEADTETTDSSSDAANEDSGGYKAPSPFGPY